MDHIAGQLNQLYEYRQQLDVVRLRMAELTDAVLSDEQRQEIAAIELEFAPQLDAVGAAIAELETRIKADVIAAGASIKGDFIQAVFMKGRVNWDPKALDGYSLSHPELLAFRNEGQPSVSLRSVTK